MAVVLTVYVFPRLWYIHDGERFPGPPGLREFNVSPIAEDGTYAAVVTEEDRLQAIVYASDGAYECFNPGGPWRAVGRLCDIPGVMLFARLFGGIRVENVNFWHELSGGYYRTMFVMQAGTTVFYSRIRADRMPDHFFVVYRLYGIAAVADWWQSAGVSYEGTMSYEEANDAIADC